MQTAFFVATNKNDNEKNEVNQSRVFLQKGEVQMLGIEDKYVALAYLLCLLSTLTCVIYGILAWNRGSEQPRKEDISWAHEEKKVEDEL